MAALESLWSLPGTLVYPLLKVIPKVWGGAVPEITSDHQPVQWEAQRWGVQMDSTREGFLEGSQRGILGPEGNLPTGRMRQAQREEEIVWSEQRQEGRGRMVSEAPMADPEFKFHPKSVGSPGGCFHGREANRPESQEDPSGAWME